MLPQSNAIMFLSTQRQVSETQTCRSCSSLLANQPFGNLRSFEEITLAEEATASIPAEKGIVRIIIPLVGTIHFENSQNDSLLNPGQALFTFEETILTNPYSDALVNFLLMKVQCTSKLEDTITCFDIDSRKNTLLNITDGQSLPQISIGKFDGRSEVLHTLQSKEHGVFVHVITGAFEVQYRLLEAKDSLTVWEADSLDLEALSNEAIILLMETPLTAQ
jgi:redox-sensitive bicupin YhaK (pirin superfamily)